MPHSSVPQFRSHDVALEEATRCLERTAAAVEDAARRVEQSQRAIERSRRKLATAKYWFEQIHE